MMKSVPLYLMEVCYLDPVTGVQGTIRVAAGVGFHTKPTDTPANTYYSPTLATTCDFQCSIFTDGVTGGSSDGGYGEAKIANDDGAYDKYCGMIFDGQPVRLLRGPSRGRYAEFVPLITGVQAAPHFEWKYLVIKVRDYTQLFDKNISPTVYMGNNVGNIGYEGTPDDLINQAKPTCWGHCLNVTPAAISTENMLFQVHDGPIEAIESVFISGVTQTLDTTQGTSGDFATADLLAAATAADGKFLTCLARGMFKISGGVSSGICAHVKGDKTGGTYVHTIGGLLKRIASTRTCIPFTNVLLQNEDKTNALWTKTGGAVALSTAIDPAVTGMLVNVVTCDASTGEHSVAQTLTQNTGMFCYADYFKAKGCSKIKLMLLDPTNAANYVSAVFDLAAGTVSGITSAGTAVGPQYEATGFITDANIVAEGTEGWYRCWIAGQPTTTFTTFIAKFFLLDGSGNASFAGSTAMDVYVGGGQVENYSSPHKYGGRTTTASLTAYDPPKAYGPSFSDSDAIFDALDAVVPYDIGYYSAVGEASTIGDVMGYLADSVGVWWGFDRAGKFIAGVFDATALAGATPVQTFDRTNIIQGSLDQTQAFDSSDGTPAYRVSVSGNPNFTTVDKSEVASSLWDTAPDWVIWLQKQFRDIRAEDLSVLAKHPLACALSFTSYIVSFADCMTEAKRRLKTYSGDLKRFAFTTKIDYAQDVTIGSVVRLQHERLGLASGRNFYVVSIAESHATGAVQIGVLG